MTRYKNAATNKFVAALFAVERPLCRALDASAAAAKMCALALAMFLPPVRVGFEIVPPHQTRFRTTFCRAQTTARIDPCRHHNRPRRLGLTSSQNRRLTKGQKTRHSWFCSIQGNLLLVKRYYNNSHILYHTYINKASIFDYIYVLSRRITARALRFSILVKSRLPDVSKVSHTHPLS